MLSMPLISSHSDLRRTLLSCSTQCRSKLLTHPGKSGQHHNPFWFPSTGCLLDKDFTHDIQGAMTPSYISDLWTPSEPNCSPRSWLEKRYHESEVYSHLCPLYLYPSQPGCVSCGLCSSTYIMLHCTCGWLNVKFSHNSLLKQYWEVGVSGLPWVIT